MTSLKQLFSRLLARISGGRTPLAIFDQALVSGANFLTNVLLARTLGLREYGVFALSWIAVLFVTSLQYAFVITPMMSVGPKQTNESRPSYFGAVLIHEFAFATMAALLLGGGVLLSTHFFPAWGVGPLAWPIAFASFAYMLQDFLRRYFFCVGKAKWALVTDIVSYVTQLPLLALLLYSHRTSLATVLWIIGGTSLLGFLGCLRLLERISVSVAALRDVAWRHWTISRWLAPSAFLQWGAGNLFAMAAPVYYGAAASAVLRAAQNIVGVSHIWFLGLENIVPAEASRKMQEDGLEGMLSYVKRIFLVWGGITLAFVGIVAAVPHFWLSVTYGSKYANEGSVLRLYALLYLITFVSGPLRSALLALEYTAPMFWAYPALIAFSAALAGPFARSLGLNGVILGMSATQVIFQSIIGGCLLSRIRKVRAREKLREQGMLVGTM